MVLQNRNHSLHRALPGKSCDLMLFEGGLYYWGCNSFSMRNIFDIFQSFFKKAPIEEVRAAAGWFFYRQKSACR